MGPALPPSLCPATLAEGRLGRGQEGEAVLPTAQPPSREKDKDIGTPASHPLLLEGKLKLRRHGVLFITYKGPIPWPPEEWAGKCLFRRDHDLGGAKAMPCICLLPLPPSGPHSPP